jgi:pilus assembly protein CpaF
VGPKGEVLGQFRPTGIRPRFSERLEQYGFRLPPNVFEAAF